MLSAFVQKCVGAMSLVAMTHSVSCGRPVGISEEHALDIEREPYRQVRTVHELPVAVQSSLAAEAGVDTLADSDSGLRSAYAIGRSTLPAARLTEAWCSADHCVVEYEVASLARRYRRILFGLTGEDATVEWNASAFRAVHGLSALRQDLLEDAGVQVPSGG